MGQNCSGSSQLDNFDGSTCYSDCSSRKDKSDGSTVYSSDSDDNLDGSTLYSKGSSQTYQELCYCQRYNHRRYGVRFLTIVLQDLVEISQCYQSMSDVYPAVTEEGVKIYCVRLIVDGRTRTTITGLTGQEALEKSINETCPWCNPKNYY